MQIIQPFFIFIITFYLILEISKWFNLNFIDSSKIFIFRSIICLAYIPILYSTNSDAFGYYHSPPLESGVFFSTGLIKSITYILKDNLHLTFVSCSLIFSFIGSIGSILLFSIIKDLTKNSDKKLKFLAGLIVYFPIFNLWTVCIGKDAITFTCINLIIFSFFNLNSRFLLLIISATFLSLIRTYLGLVLIFGLIISITQKASFPLFYKLFFIGSSSIFLVILINLSSKFFPSLSLYDISERLTDYGVSTSVGSTAIDLSSSSLPMKIFTYLFRPLFFEARDLFTILMAVENTILLFVVVYPLLISIKNKKFIRFELNSLQVFLIIFLIGTTIPYSIVTSNLGMAYRHKITLLPALIYLSLSKSKNKISKPINLV